MAFYFVHSLQEDEIVAENLALAREHKASADEHYRSAREEVGKGLHLDPMKLLSHYALGIVHCYQSRKHDQIANDRLDHFHERGIDHLIS